MDSSWSASSIATGAPVVLSASGGLRVTGASGLTVSELASSSTTDPPVGGKPVYVSPSSGRIVSCDRQVRLEELDNVSATAPSADGEALTWNSTTSEWEARAVPPPPDVSAFVVNGRLNPTAGDPTTDPILISSSSGSAAVESVELRATAADGSILLSADGAASAGAGVYTNVGAVGGAGAYSASASVSGTGGGVIIVDKNETGARNSVEVLSGDSVLVANDYRVYSNQGGFFNVASGITMQTPNGITFQTSGSSQWFAFGNVFNVFSSNVLSLWCDGGNVLIRSKDFFELQRPSLSGGGAPSYVRITFPSHGAYQMTEVAFPPRSGNVVFATGSDMPLAISAPVVNEQTIRYDSAVSSWRNSPLPHIPMREAFSTSALSVTLTTVNTWYTLDLDAAGAVMFPATATTLWELSTTTPTTRRLRWKGPLAHFHTALSVSASTPSAGEDFEVALSLNGSNTPIAGSIYRVDFAANNRAVMIAIHKVVELATNDTLTVLFRCTSSGNRTVSTNNVNIVAMGCAPTFTV